MGGGSASPNPTPASRNVKQGRRVAGRNVPVVGQGFVPGHATRRSWAALRIGTVSHCLPGRLFAGEQLEVHRRL